MIEISMSLLLLFLAIFIAIKERSLINPISVLTIFYGSTIFLNSLRLFGIYDTSILVLSIVVLGNISFTIGGLLANVLSIRKKRGIYDIRQLALVFSISIMLFYSFIQLQLYLKYLSLGYSLDMIRLIYFSEEIRNSLGIYQNPILGFVNTYVYIPVLYISIFLTSALIYNLEQRKKNIRTNTVFIVVTIISAVTNALSTGGRLIIYVLLMLTIMGYFLYNFKNFKVLIIKKSTFTKMVAIILVLGILVFAVLEITSIRNSNGGNSFFKEIYLYFTGYLPHLTVKLTNISVSDTFTFGFSFVSGILQPIFMLLKNIFSIQYPLLLDRSINFFVDANKTVSIGSEINYNAFVSMFYSFYRDFSFIGVIIYSSTFGFISNYIFRVLKKSKNIKNQLIYNFVLFLIVTSIVRWQLGVVSFGMIIFYIPFFVRRHFL